MLLCHGTFIGVLYIPAEYLRHFGMVSFEYVTGDIVECTHAGYSPHAVLLHAITSYQPHASQDIRWSIRRITPTVTVSISNSIYVLTISYSKPQPS